MSASVSDVVGRNRAYWEQHAPHRLSQPADFFLHGGSVLTDEELAAVGDLTFLERNMITLDAGPEMYPGLGRRADSLPATYPLTAERQR